MKFLIYLIVAGAAVGLFAAVDLPQLEEGETAVAPTAIPAWALATAVPPPGWAAIEAGGVGETATAVASAPTLPDAVTADYSFIEAAPVALRYCFAPGVPGQAQAAIAAGFEAWSSAYPLAHATGDECNLIVGWIGNEQFYRHAEAGGTIWGQAWGNVCDEPIHPYIINFDNLRPADAGLTALAAHELGHVLCLEHTAVAGNVMHPSAYSLPAAADIEAARQAIGRYR